MAEVIWTEPALANLDDIASYIALSNPPAAKSFVTHVFNRVSNLETFPLCGKEPTEIKGLNYREIIVNPSRVLYKVSADKVYILHVLRQERSLRKYLHL